MQPALPFDVTIGWWIWLAVLGLTVGVIGGLFGIGGGFLLTPLMSVVFKVPMDIAIGSGLCQMIGTGIASLVRHQKLKQGEIRIDWFMLAGGLLGVKLGADLVALLGTSAPITLLGKTFPGARLVLSLSYAMLILLVALWMIRDAQQRPNAESSEPGPLTRLNIPPLVELPMAGRRISGIVLAYLGLLLGFVSGFLGIGGGIILMPILLYGIGMRIRMAAGTGILMIVVTSIFGTYVHAMANHVHLGISLCLLSGSTIGAPVGATFASRIDGQRQRRLFVGILLLTAVAVLWNLFRPA